jgi:hypothetical protein
MGDPAINGGTVVNFEVFDHGTGPGLIACGQFKSALDSHDSFLARWGCFEEPPVIDCPTELIVLDRKNGPPGETVAYSVTATDSCDPAPTVVCVPPSGSFFPRGTTVVTCTATDSAGQQSTRTFPVVVRPRVRAR